MGTTFADSYGAVQSRLKLDTSNTAETTKLKALTNNRYKTIAAEEDWQWLYKKTTLKTVAEYTTGTVTVEEGSTTVTGTGTVFTSAMTGRKIRITGFDEIYTVTYVSGTELTLDNEYNGEDAEDVGYTIFNDEVSLPADCEFIEVLRQHMNPTEITSVSLNIMRRNHPSSYPQGRDPDEYAIYEPDSNGYTKILLYPAPYRQIVLDLDYKILITELTDDTDEPLIPENYRQLLEHGVMADIYNDNDDTRAAFFESKFTALLKKMRKKYARNQGNPRFTPEEPDDSQVDLQTICDNYNLGLDTFLRA